MIYSRDIKFNKMEFGLENESSSIESTQYVELEVSSSTEEPQDSTESNADVGTETSEDIDRLQYEGRAESDKGQITTWNEYLLLKMD